MTPPHVERHTGLGRGLEALIPQTTPIGSAPVEIPITRIRGNPYQPRQRVEQKALESLASSIAIHGSAGRLPVGGWRAPCSSGTDGRP